MKHRQLWQGLFASIGILFLILDGKTAMEGASSGIDLCLKTVIPSLFPFFLLSMLLTNALSGSASFLRPLGKLCKIPEGAESILLSGFLGGYPVGAQCIAASWKNGMISRDEAIRMLTFCSNAGPSFLFGMITPLFPSIGYGWLLWGVQIASALLVAASVPGASSSSVPTAKPSSLSIPEALRASLRVMASVCGWVVLFRVILAFLERWVFWMLPAQGSVILSGILELSNGCCMLPGIADVGMRFLICSVMLAFGGICVTMQTMSVITGLDGRAYILGKLLQSGYAFVLSCGIVYRSWFVCFLLLSAAVPILRTLQKNSSIHAAIGV